MRTHLHSFNTHLHFMTEKITTVLDRIDELIKAKGLSYRAFSMSIGTPPMTLSSMFKRRSDPSALFIATIVSVYPDVSPEWLLLGKGDMFKKESIIPQVSYSEGRPYYNVDFIGGFDLILNDQTINPEYNINFQPYNKEGVIWCNITGHSMEPEIHNGDMIAIKKISESNINYLPFGEVYAIITDEYRTVKRISKSDKEGFIRLIPSNRSPEYAPQDIPISMIKSIFLVLANVKRF